jgi:hypothetical protein
MDIQIINSLCDKRELVVGMALSMAVDAPA